MRPRPSYDAALIEDLRSRVRSHNASGAPAVKLGELKKLYERHYKGAQPGARAMAKVDAHLDELAKAFNGDDHPRDKNGRFKPKNDEQGSIFDDHIENVKNAASAAGEAAARGAHYTAYAAGFTEAPLPKGVKVPKSPFRTPKSVDEHRVLQANDAGYSAMTSGVIPEFRGELAGSFLRPAIAAGTGYLVASGLANANRTPKGFAAKATESAVRGVGRAGGGFISHVVVGVPAHVVMGAVRQAYKIVGETDPEVLAGYTAKASNLVRRVGNVTMPGGERIAARAYRTLGSVVRTSEDAAAGSRKTPIGRAVMRFGARSVVALPIAYGVDRLLTGSVVDPVALGQGYDQYSYRVVRKAIMSDDLAKVSRDMTAALRAGGDELQKRSRFIGLTESALYHAGGAALGAISGALTGGATAAVRDSLTRKGNPYHDSHGRFASKDSAAVNEHGSAIIRGALTGAAIGGGLGLGITNRLVARHNAAFIERAFDHLDRHTAAQFESVREPTEDAPVKKPHEEIAKLLARKAAFVKKTVDESPEIKSIDESEERFGGADPIHYQEAMKRELNDHLATRLIHDAGFRIPIGDKKLTFDEIQQIPKYNPNRGVSVHTIYDKVSQELSMMNDAQFKEALSNVDPELRDYALNLKAKVKEGMAGIDAILTKHRKAIDDLRAEQEAAKKVTDEADAKMQQLEPVAEGKKSPAYTAAVKAHDKAYKEQEKLATKMENLRRKGPTVKSPLTGDVMPPIMESTRAVNRSTVMHRVEQAASKKYDAKVRAARTRIRNNIYVNMNARHAALVFLQHPSKVPIAARRRQLRAFGQRMRAKMDSLRGVYGYKRTESPKPETSAPSVKTPAQALDAMVEAKLNLKPYAAKSRSAHAGLINAERRLAEVTAQRSAISGVRSMSADEKKAFDAEIDSATELRDAAKAKTQAASAAARPFMHAYAKAAMDYRESLAGRGPRTSGIYSAVRRDVHRAAARVGTPINNFLLKPTANYARGAWSKTPDWVKNTGESIKNNSIAVMRDLFMRPTTIDGQTKYVIHPGKVAAALGTGAAGVVAKETRDWFKYAHSQVTGGDKKAPKSKTHIEYYAHPVDGSGYFGVSMDHPENKGDRVLLWGERILKNDEGEMPLRSFSKVSDLKRLYENNNAAAGPNGQRDAGFLNEDETRNIDGQIKALFKINKITTVAGPGMSVQFRDNNDNTADSAAGTFKNKFTNQHLSKGGPEGDKIYAALGDLFSNQGRILKSGAAYSLLTGYRHDGAKAGTGILPDQSDFGSNDSGEAVAALDGAIEKIVSESPPQSPAQQMLLKKAIATVGHVRRIPAPSLAPIYEKVGKDSPGPNANRGGSANTKQSRKEDFGEAPWSDDTSADAAEASVGHIARSLGMTSSADRATLSAALDVMARQVYKATGYDLPKSMDIARRAIIRHSNGGTDVTRQALREASPMTFSRSLHAEIEAERNKNNKADFVLSGDDLDDLNALMKRASVPGQNQNQSGTPKASKFGRDIERDAIGATVGSATQFAPFDLRTAARREISGHIQRGIGLASQQTVPQYKASAEIPAVAAEVGAGALVGALGRKLTGAPKLPATFWPNKIYAAVKAPTLGGTFKNVARVGGVGLVSGLAGSALYNGVSNALGGGSYGRKTTPGEIATQGIANAVAQGPGGQIGSAIGSAAGAFIGTDILPGIGTEAGAAAGKVAGHFLGETIGGALGEALGHFGYKAFAGYPPEQVSRIMGQKVAAAPGKPVVPGQAAAATAGDAIGSAVGSAFGQKYEPLGSLAGSVAGSLGANAVNAASGNSSTLPGRPNPSGSGSGL